MSALNTRHALNTHSNLLHQVKHLLRMFKELWHTCSTLDYEEFLRRRVYMRVQASSFNDHVALIWGPEAITPKMASLEYLFPYIAYELPVGIPLGYLNEQPVEAHHIVRKTDRLGASGRDPASWRLSRIRRVAIRCHKWLHDREPGNYIDKTREVLKVAKRIKVELAAVKLAPNDDDDDVVEPEVDDDTEIISNLQQLWRREIATLEVQRLQITLNALELRFGTDEYVNPPVMSYCTPERAYLGKGTVGRIPIDLMYGGHGTIKVGVEHSSGGTSWRVKMGWRSVHSISFTPTTVTIETTDPMIVLAQPRSKGKHMTQIDGIPVGTNLQHAAHISITFQSEEDLDKFRNGLEALGTPGMLSSAQTRPMFPDQRLDTTPSIERRKMLKAQADPLGAFIRGETISLLKRRVAMYEATHPERMNHSHCRTMAPGSGRPFFRECAACHSQPCPTCGMKWQLLVWIDDNGKLDSDGDVDHQMCPTTYNDPRMGRTTSERCLCGIDMATRSQHLFDTM